MGNFDLYQDIRVRTGGEIYVGIVGPVRTGKSTFARKFIEQLVLPHLEDADRERTRDEMPASGSGRTVTTVEPKFLPRNAAQIPVGDGSSMAVRLVDCVGYLVPGAEGVLEDGRPRMVKTPWQQEPMPFAQAARTGTQKVIADHATLGLVITTDGSFGEIPRRSFVEAEKETIRELQKIGKPFLVIVNSADPHAEEAKSAAAELEASCHVRAVLLNCEKLDSNDILRIFEALLLEFPLTRVVFRIPKWAETLENFHWLKQSLFASVREAMQHLNLVRDVSSIGSLLENPWIRRCRPEHIKLSDGSAEVAVEMQESLYYDILSEMTGTEIRSEYQLVSLVRELAGQRAEYEAVRSAVAAARQSGYGVIPPGQAEVQIQEPVMIRQGSRFGVKIRATAPSIHLIRADVTTEIAPIVGSEEQARDLIAYIGESHAGQEGAVHALIFGKSVEQLIDEEIRSRLSSVREESQQKLQTAMKRIVNESKGKIIFIII